ncbi:hypothetical protein ScPMuIL_016266 [Solemya velum]
MGPIRRSGRPPATRTVPIVYDASLPDNWTVSKLKQELSARGVAFTTNMKRAQLIMLFKSARANPNNNFANFDPVSSGSRQTTEQPNTRGRMSRRSAPSTVSLGEQPTSRDITSAPVPVSLPSTAPRDARDQHGDHLLSAILSLTETVHQMQATLLSTLQRPEPAPQTPAEPSSLPTENLIPTTTPHTATSAILASASEPVTDSANDDGFYVRTRYGYSAESLPFVETVSPTLRRSIVEGKDVNLASLLIPNYKPSGTKTVGDNTEKPDHRLSKSLSLAEFIQAFGVYKNIMCETFPQRRPELDLYERDIVDMATQYQGLGFYDYHKQFSAKAAAQVLYRNIPVDWSVRNNSLFCNIFSHFTPSHVPLATVPAILLPSVT